MQEFQNVSIYRKLLTIQLTCNVTERFGLGSGHLFREIIWFAINVSIDKPSNESRWMIQLCFFPVYPQYCDK